jgi:TonB-linked SusC/RagA family outer membrane protein
MLKRNSKVDRVVASGSVTVDFMDMFGINDKNHKLAYNLNLSQSKTFVKNLTFVPSFIQSTTNYLSKSGEILTHGTINYSDGLIENTLTYDGTFGRSKVNAVVGQTFEHNSQYILTGVGHSLSEPYYLHLNNAEETDATSYEGESGLASYIGRLNYNFDDKYLLSATVRRDESSRLSFDSRVGWFPSLSAGWRLERESFFPVAETTVNLFKIRGSYGELGSTSNLGPYEYTSTMLRGNYTYSFGNTKVTGSSLSNYVNTALKWEKKKTLDIGLDLGMFNNQFEFTFDWFKSTSEDLIFDVAVPSNAGATNATVRMNAATMVNSGLEFLMAYHNHNHAIKFDIVTNLSTQKNEVIKLDATNKPRTDGYCRTEVGREVGSFYGLVSEGIFKSQTEIDNNYNDEGELVTQPGAQEGDVKYKDVNKDGQITLEGDQTFLGSGLAKIHYGLNLSAEWKGFDLSISTYGAAGFKAVDFVDVTLRSSYGALNKDVSLLNAWTLENTNTDVPRVAYKSTGSITNDMFSQRFIQNASYLKIANVELGYNFPDKWFGGYVKGVRLYASAQNVTTLSKYKGYNVDFAGGTFTPGYNYASYPTPRTIMFGAHFSF